MCDYSLHNVKTRDAKVGDELITRDFGSGTRGFADVHELDCAVCLKEGTELGFDDEIKHGAAMSMSMSPFTVAKFTQLNKDQTHTHHDALQFPDESTVLLTRLDERQRARVLQLPHEEKIEAKAEEPEKV